MTPPTTEPTSGTATTTSVEVDPLVTELQAVCRGQVVGNASIAGLTTLRVGGPARVLVTAEADEDLAAVGRACATWQVPFAVVGRGSNLLVGDGGVPGIVVQLGRGYRGLEFDGSEVRAGAAEPLPVMAVKVADAGYQGFAWACAVPGTLGGAVRMNAGAHGGEMADHLVEVEVVRLRSGTRETWPVQALGLTYRHSELPDDAVVVGASLRLLPGDPASIRADIDRIRTWRRTHQPLNEPNCGSVFTNPPGDSAGRLIEAAGAKGLRVGGAQVSDRHANFIVTRPGARAEDVEALIEQVRARVAESAGVTLVTEVARVGLVAVAPEGAGGQADAACEVDAPAAGGEAHATGTGPAGEGSA
jgi:UDP-N-acetylmuramate dehydrogenase